ncbi:Ethanolamine-phosphate cytidylyltransferase [Phytophthora megakarya]|uniref:Ethanolamine-phosphate cytidylyltransferase n=1 Tax=Phytophthora megakarya TaxID=4795 RepID=A0A225UD29_9STRA|nr:Ethanolamine-phosphate cytidylyltransferase [Phytophthora megakarya]
MVNNDERIAPVGGCKYVDESYGLGYITNEKYLQCLLKKYCIDYVIHGYDLCIIFLTTYGTDQSVYIDGALDMLQLATWISRVAPNCRAHIVGVHNDNVMEAVNRGFNHIVMNLHERVVSAFRYCLLKDDFKHVYTKAKVNRSAT